jgi:hypothetical protein
LLFLPGIKKTLEQFKKRDNEVLFDHIGGFGKLNYRRHDKIV